MECQHWVDSLTDATDRLLGVYVQRNPSDEMSALSAPGAIEQDRYDRTKSFGED